MPNHNNNKVSSGFTLTELLIAVAIVGILMAAAAPSFRETILKNRTSSYATDFKMALYIAQNEAIKRGIQVTVKPTSATSQVWTGGWNIFVDDNNNETHETGEELIQTYVPEDSTFNLKAGTTEFGNWIAFTTAGTPLGASGEADGEFRLCRPDSDTSLSRTIKITYAGNITVKEGTSSCP